MVPTLNLLGIPQFKNLAPNVTSASEALPDRSGQYPSAVYDPIEYTIYKNNVISNQLGFSRGSTNSEFSTILTTNSNLTNLQSDHPSLAPVFAKISSNSKLLVNWKTSFYSPTEEPRMKSSPMAISIIAFGCQIEGYVN